MIIFQEEEVAAAAMTKRTTDLCDAVTMNERNDERTHGATANRLSIMVTMEGGGHQIAAAHQLLLVFGTNDWIQEEEKEWNESQALYQEQIGEYIPAD